MSDTDKNICTTSGDEVKLIFACSGGADVGHLSDLAARQMMMEGCCIMFCLAGVGGGVEPIIKSTRDADKILAIDGCPVDCAKKTLEQAGITGFQQFQVTALGFEKGKTAVNENSIREVADHGKNLFT
jgi:uncharacterized metal-binding protein